MQTNQHLCISFEEVASLLSLLHAGPTNRITPKQRDFLFHLHRCLRLSQTD